MNHDRSTMQKIGNRIQRLRKERHYTQQEFAEKVGISTNYLSDLERGVSSPRMDNLVAIINALECSADDVFVDVLDCRYKIRSSKLNEELYSLSPYEQQLAFAILEAFIQNVKDIQN